MSRFQPLYPREYVYREYDFVAYVSRTPAAFLYLGLIERDSLSITIEDVRSTDEETGGELLYYKVFIEFKCVQLNLTTVKGIDNYKELTKGKWFLYLECVQDKNISFSTPFRVGLKTQQVHKYNDYYTLIQASFLTNDVGWLKGDRFSQPVFVSPYNNQINVATNTQVVIDVEKEVLFDFRIRAGDIIVIEILNIFSTNGKINNDTFDSRISVSDSPLENWKRLTFTIPTLTMATLYRVEFVGRKFGYTSSAHIVFTTMLSAPTFEVPPTFNANAEYLTLETISIQTRRTNNVSQEVLIDIKNTNNPSNPITVLQSSRLYNTSSNLSVIQSFTPTAFARYTVSVRDRANGVESSVVTRDVFFIDKYEELASRSNVLLAWNSLKAIHANGIVTSLQLDGQGIANVKPNLNLPTNASARPLIVTDSSHKGYNVLYAQVNNHLYADTAFFTGAQIAVFLMKKTNSFDNTLFGAGTPYVSNWRLRSFTNNIIGQSYWSPSTGEKFDNVFNREFYERDANGNIVSDNTINPHPLNKWILVAIQYNIPITVANFALFGSGDTPAARNAYLSIGFILNSNNWADRLDFVDYLKLFL